MKVKTDFVPDDCDYFTVGKEYEVIQSDGNVGGVVIDDSGERAVLHFPMCAHLNNHPWTIIDEPHE